VVGTRRAYFSSPATALIAFGGVLFAVVDGALLAMDLKPGIGLVAAIAYTPLVLIALPVGIALWVPLIFIAHLPVVSVAPNVAGLLIALAWVGMLRAQRAAVMDVLRRHRRLIVWMLVLLVWLSLSLAWAPDPRMAGPTLLGWYLAVLLFAVVATAIGDPRDIRLVLAAFVAGAALSVAIGLVDGGLGPAGSAIQTATETEGRLQGGGGDPNYLAAGLVPALAVAGGLAATTRNAAVRWALALVAVVLIAGFGATQSRGGLVGAAVAVVAAFVVFKRRRPQVALVVACAVTVAGAWFAANPAAWTRITHLGGAGNGRSDVWRTAWRITEDHPVVGVGLNNFRVYAPRYVRRPGQLQFVQLIADRPRVVHNTYLQVLVETGAIGLGLFLLVIGSCLGVLWRAAKRFDAIGNQSLATIARSVLVAVIGALAASFFISNATDQRIWLLLALGPALLATARRLERGER